MLAYTPNQLGKGLTALFMQQLAQERSGFADMIATVQKSDTNAETYPFLGESPQMVEHDGANGTSEALIGDLVDKTYSLTNKLYKATLLVKRSDLEDNLIGSLAMRVRQLASVAARHDNKLLIDALINGTTDTDFTGVAFFSNSHTAIGKQSAAGDNIIAGTGTTTAQVSADINSALAQMMGFKATNDEPFHEDIVSAVLVCHPTIRQPVMEALNATIISNTSNVGFTGVDIKPLFTARLSDTNDWYLLNTSSPVRPLLLQDRVPVSFEALEGQSDSAFLREHYLYQVRRRAVVGYSFWQHAVKVTNT